MAGLLPAQQCNHNPHHPHSTLTSGAMGCKGVEESMSLVNAELGFCGGYSDCRELY